MIPGPELEGVAVSWVSTCSVETRAYRRRFLRKAHVRKMGGFDRPTPPFCELKAAGYVPISREAARPRPTLFPRSGDLRALFKKSFSRRNRKNDGVLRRMLRARASRALLFVRDLRIVQPQAGT